MSPEDIEKWREAGRITAQARDFGAALIKKGASMTAVCDAIDQKMIDLGAQPAFPAQASCNEIAAHFCVDEEDIIFDDQIVKLDVGANVDGFLGDSAVTVDLSGKYADLAKAAKEAMEAGIRIVAPGTMLGSIGKEVEQVIEGYGYKPILNLCGHGVAPFEIHTKPTVPNFDNGDTNKLVAGQIITIEPFATTGQGRIHESGQSTVFMQRQKKPVRDLMSRAVLKEIAQYNGTPFASRHLAKKIPRAKLNFALRNLVAAGILEQFPPLVEVTGGLVSQYEHTMLVTENGCEVLTKEA